MFRSNLMRASFLAQDSGLARGSQSLAQQMAAPTRLSMEALKHLAWYLKGRPSVANALKQQRMPKHIRVSVDSGLAADRRS